MKQKKQELRKYIRARMAELSAAQIQRLSEVALQRLETLPEFASAANVAAYWSMPSELATHDFVEKWAARKNIFLPVVDGKNMSFMAFEGRENMLENRFGIAEPQIKIELQEPVFDIIIVPAMGYDSQGHRLGHGAGFYDRYFARQGATNTLKIGVCLDCQLLEAIPKEDFDVDLDMVITPTKVIDLR